MHDENEDNKMVGMQLLTNLAPTLGREYCEEFVTKEIFVLVEQQRSLRVSKWAMMCLPALTKVVSPEYFQTVIMDFYKKKCD